MIISRSLIGPELASWLLIGCWCQTLSEPEPRNAAPCWAAERQSKAELGLQTEFNNPCKHGLALAQPGRAQSGRARN